MKTKRLEKAAKHKQTHEQVPAKSCVGLHNSIFSFALFGFAAADDDKRFFTSKVKPLKVRRVMANHMVVTRWGFFCTMHGPKTIKKLNYS